MPTWQAMTWTKGKQLIEVRTPYELESRVGKLLGVSEWLEIDQARIDAFAQVSGDHNWIHVDVERSRSEMPQGKTVAHGMLTFSLLSLMAQEILSIKEKSRSVNYGSNKVRFTTMVTVGSRIRLHRKLKAYERMDGGVRLTYENTVEVEGQEKPALVAETLNLIYVRESQS